MSRTVHCVKLGREAEGLAIAPYPGDLGKRILESISKDAWQQWLARQTMLVNENRLALRNAEHRKFLENEMVRFLFEGEDVRPAGYVRPSTAEGSTT